MGKAFILLLFLSFWGCVSVSPQWQLNFEANRALVQKDYIVAMQKYDEALTAAEVNNDTQYQAMAMYGLGRANGYSCNFKEAEQWFLKSIALRENIPDSKDAYLSQNLLELARLYKSAGQYDKANSQFEKAIPLLENLNIEHSDPACYAKVIEDYVLTLEKSGNHEKGNKIKNRIKSLKNKYQNGRAEFVAREYPSHCNF